MCTAGILVMTAVIGGTLAGFNTTTEQKSVSNITVKSLGIQMVGTGQTETLEENTLKDHVIPGGTVGLEKNIVNNVRDGYDVYTRVTIDKQWENKELDSSLIQLFASEEELVQGEKINDWFVWHADDEQIIMYYSKPLKAGESTSDFISRLDFSHKMNNNYTKAEVNISFRADAIQVIAAEDAMPSEWGIYPVIDENGIITAIEE